MLSKLKLGSLSCRYINWGINIRIFKCVNVMLNVHVMFYCKIKCSIFLLKIGYDYNQADFQVLFIAPMSMKAGVIGDWN